MATCQFSVLFNDYHQSVGKSSTQVEALAASITGLVALTLAIEIFFLERVIGAEKERKGASILSLFGLLSFSIYGLCTAATAWWAWAQVGSLPTTAAFGITTKSLLAIAFGPLHVFGAGSALFAAGLLLRRVMRFITRTPP